MILAAGSGTRLHPITAAISKQLIPIFDKPMIYYPLTTLILAGVREVRIVVNFEHLDAFGRLLGDGSEFGIDISYSVQEKPNGLVGAILAGADHLEDKNCAVILGDNLFYGQGAGTSLARIVPGHSGARIFAKTVPDPTGFGVIELDKDESTVLSIEEKPKDPKSNLVATGLYFYDETLLQRAKSVKPSPRGELEITDLNRDYLKDGSLAVEILPQSTVWLDTGTINGLSEASEFVRVVQARQGRVIGSPQEAARVSGFN
jgi:glucose-1-phosphate thymidylyltransferase